MRRVQFVFGSTAVICLAVGGVLYATASNQHTHHTTAPGGSITGRVVDAEGIPVGGAEVYADRNESPTGRRPDALTDEQGAFSFNNLAPGVYTVSAAKEDAGYPPTDSIFYAVGAVDTPQVSVYEQQTTSDVVVNLTQKAARLRGKVIDHVSGKPINSAQVSMCRADLPDRCYRTSLNLLEEAGAFDLLIPPVPTTIEVSAPAHAKRNLDPLHLQKGEIKWVNISLLPRN